MSEREVDALTVKLQRYTEVAHEQANEVQALRDDLKVTKANLQHCKTQHAVRDCQEN